MWYLIVSIQDLCTLTYLRSSYYFFLSDSFLQSGHPFQLVTKDAMQEHDASLLNIQDLQKNADQDLNIDNLEKKHIHIVESESETDTLELTEGLAAISRPQEQDFSEDDNKTFSDTDDLAVKLTVYSADKVEETDDSEFDPDLDNDLVGENKAEIDIFYGDDCEKSPAFDCTDQELDEQSEEMSLLMENATRKMRCMSQRLSVSDDQVNINVNDTVEEEDTDVVREEDTDTQSPLLQEKEHFKPDPDEPHNVEC